MMLRYVIAAMLLAIVATPAMAQDQMAVATAQSCLLKVGERESSCEHVVFFMIPSTGRVNFTVPLANGALGFSGGKDRQPSLTNYFLTVDRLLAARKTGNQELPATGECHLTVSDDGMVFKRIQCVVNQPRYGTVTLDFIGDGQQVERSPI